MAKDLFMTSRRPPDSTGYRIFRRLARLWISLFQPKLRVVGADDLTGIGPALFMVSQPGGFLDAVLLVAASSRQVHCMVDRGDLRGAFRKLIAHGLKMISYEREGDGWRRAVETACNTLGRSRAVAVFAEAQPVEIADTSQFARTAATITIEAESRNANQLDVRVVPTHLLLPARRIGGERMVYFDRRIPSQAYLLQGKAADEKRQVLCLAIEEICRRNVFRLQPEDVQNSLHDLEEVLREDLAEDFASRPKWKQKAEGFDLSGFIVDWAEQMNFLNPGGLVGLRELLIAYREARRLAALERLEVEASGAWLGSALRRTVGWAETLLGFPIALYGSLNHLLIAGLSYTSGLLKKQTEMDRIALWTARVVIVVVCYAAQIFLCHYWGGRAMAGYYALSLPVSGLYLWRYGWLLRRRSRLLFLNASISRRAVRLREMRKDLVKELNIARDAYVDAVDLAH